MTVSQVLANELRELYDLPPISKEEMTKKSSDIIINLRGFLKDYANTDSEENMVDATKSCIESISWFKCLVFLSFKKDVNKDGDISIESQPVDKIINKIISDKNTIALTSHLVIL